jgi:hypothetical protein
LLLFKFIYLLSLRFRDVFEIRNALIWQGEWEIGLPLPFDTDIDIVGESDQKTSDSSLLYLKGAEDTFISSIQNDENTILSQGIARGMADGKVTSLAYRITKALQPLRDFYLEVALPRILASRRLGTLDVSANVFTKEGRLLNVNGSGGDGGDVSDEGWQRKRKVQVVRLGEGRTRAEIEFLVESTIL